MVDFKPFNSWNDVLVAAASGEHLWYQGPLDHRPHSIYVIKVFKNGSLRIDPLNNQVDKFTADKGHLDRFRRRA